MQSDDGLSVGELAEKIGWDIGAIVEGVSLLADEDILTLREMIRDVVSWVASAQKCGEVLP